jgi:hypothetical protein
VNSYVVRRYEEFTRYLTSTLRSLKEQQGMTLAAAKARPKQVEGGDVGRMVTSSKAGRREAQTSRRERQRHKLKEKGGVATSAATPAREPHVKDQRNTARKLFGASPAASSKRQELAAPFSAPQGPQQDASRATTPPSPDTPKRARRDTAG